MSEEATPEPFDQWLEHSLRLQDALTDSDSIGLVLHDANGNLTFEFEGREYLVAPVKGNS